MKMRRMRVRSLLAGCISCLRCVRTSALTCRSSPVWVPPHSSRLLSVRGASLFSLLLRPPELLISFSSSTAAKMRVSGILLCAYWSWFLVASPFSAPRRRAYLSLRRTELDIRLKRRNQPSRPMHACEPAPWCCQNFTCPSQRCCRRSRQKINEAVTDGNGSGCCVAQRGRFKHARKWELLLLTISRKH